MTISSCYATSPQSDGSQNAEPCQGRYVEGRFRLFVSFEGFVLGISLSGGLSGVFERLYGLVAVTVGLTLFTSSLEEVSGFKCRYASLEGL